VARSGLHSCPSFSWPLTGRKYGVEGDEIGSDGVEPMMDGDEERITKKITVTPIAGGNRDDPGTERRPTVVDRA